jgi:type IV secretory pathway VirB3-like protein
MQAKQRSDRRAEAGASQSAVARERPHQLYGVCYTAVMLNAMITVIPFILFNTGWVLLLALPIHFWFRRLDRRNPWWADDLLQDIIARQAEDTRKREEAKSQQALGLNASATKKPRPVWLKVAIFCALFLIALVIWLFASENIILFTGDATVD